MAPALPKGGDAEPLLVLFFFLHIFGWTFSLLMLLIAIFSTKVSRNMTWLNLCTAWIIACFSFSFLLISGQVGKQTPQRDICLFQASMVYAVPALTAGATLALAIHTWSIVRASVSSMGMEGKDHARAKWNESIRNIVLVATSYLFPIGLMIGVFVFGLQNRNLVVLAPHGLYCGVKNEIPGKITAIYVATLMVPTLFFEGMIIAVLYRNWKSYAIRQVSGLSTMIRLGVFTAFGIFSIGISLSYLSGGTLGRLPNVLQALPPVSFVIVFSSQKDIMRTLLLYYETPLSRRLKILLSSNGSVSTANTADTSGTSMDFGTNTKVTVTTTTLTTTDLHGTPDDVEKLAGMKPMEVPKPF